MWRLWFKRFGAKIVAMQTYSDGIIYRFAKPCVFGKYSCNYGFHRRVLNEDGGSPYSLILKWREV